MGMFDTVICRYELPLNDKLKGLNVNWKETDFQTKSLENYMALYFITEDGYLEEEVVEREYVPYSDEEMKSAKAWDYYKEIIVKNRYNKRSEHHGTVSFYTSIEHTDEEDVWVEFIAYFLYGKLDKIELLDCRHTISAKAANLMWQKKREKINNLPWNKFKALCRPFGWHYAWNKIAKLISKTQNQLGKLQHFIYREML